ncbi:DUF6973 domain-containing protein [Dyadobacter psychrophilus]|uniref:DUF6973 domain-containing protein n=1 Tax=Dyadobacter psychrophilus TaxID=651661 RepID=A0A1T5FDR0_9BACT|nr:hypothetical protein [Dyadobacter psychrophilus]SKB94188.1 hypothetical protein SAMN05660293_03072 [Dyadobacter psychrophilus]
MGFTLQKAVCLLPSINKFIMLLAATMVFTGCEHDTRVRQKIEAEKQADMKEVIYKNLSAQMPIAYPEEILDFSPSDLEYIALTENLNGASHLRTINGNTFDEIVEGVRKNYPDFDNATPEEYKPYFPKLSTEQIIENQDIVFQYVEKLMGYEVAISVAASRSGRTKSNLRTSYGTSNSCDEWYYATHLRLDKGGMDKARDLAKSKAGVLEDERQDANRHAIWNVYLGKYAAYRYGSVGEAMGVVQGLTEAHECDVPQNKALSKDMDLFNNLVGLLYFSQIAQKYKKNIFDYNVKVTKTDDEIYTYIKSLNDRMAASSAEISNGPLNILVRLK